MKSPPPFEAELSARLESIPRARHQVAQWLGRRHVSRAIREEMALVVTELVTNAIEASPDQSAQIRVRLRVDAEHLVLAVADQGAGFNSLLVAPLPDIHTERGRGLPIVSALADRVTVHRQPGCTEVEVTRRLPDNATSPAMKSDR